MMKSPIVLKSTQEHFICLQCVSVAFPSIFLWQQMYGYIKKHTQWWMDGWMVGRTDGWTFIYL